MRYSWELLYEGKPWGLNEERTQHWNVRDQRTAEWRDAYKKLARYLKVPQMKAITIEVQHFYKRTRMDPVAIMPAYKAALDGIVDAKVIADDDGRYVKSVLFLPPEKAEKDGLALIIEEWTDAEK